MKSVKYPDASLKKVFSLNPAVLFLLFHPAIWRALYILLPLYYFASNGRTFLPTMCNKCIWRIWRHAAKVARWIKSHHVMQSDPGRFRQIKRRWYWSIKVCSILHYHWWFTRLICIWRILRHAAKVARWIKFHHVIQSDPGRFRQIKRRSYWSIKVK